MALHLYLPPHSCHAPGVLSGLVSGNILRIHQLCSDTKNVKKEVKLSFHRLLDRGYQTTQLIPYFQQTIDKAKAYFKQTALDRLHPWSKKETSNRRQVFLHLPYHPANPSSKTIQNLWTRKIANPPGHPALSSLTSCHTGNYLTTWG